MKLKYFLLLVITFSIFHLTSSIAAVRYVSHEGSSTPPYTTWETAADSIQKCIDICGFGDTIYVANGVYKEQVELTPGLTLIGMGMDSCIIDARGLNHNPGTVYVDTNCVIDGFKIITSNSIYEGIGIWGDGNNYISNNKIVNAFTGIWIFNSNGIVENNVLENVDKGILIEAYFRDYFPIIIDNFIYYPNSTGISKAVGTSPKICNNTILLNEELSDGITCVITDSLFIHNNLIISEVGQIGISNPPDTYLLNYNNQIEGDFDWAGIYVNPGNIIENNNITNGVIGIRKYGQSSATIQYNNIWNNQENFINFTPDSTNLSVNPMVVNADSLDFHLQKYSPLIDAGDPDILDIDETRSDIGLYGGPYGDRYMYLDYPPAVPKDFNVDLDSIEKRITIGWLMNSETDFSSYIIYKDTSTGFTPDSSNLYAVTDTSFFEDYYASNKSNIYYKVTAVDSQGNQSNPGEEIAIILVDINEPGIEIITEYKLYQNYPNPFNPSTKIGYRLKERGNVRLTVYAITGALVSVLVNKEQGAGYYEVEFSSQSLPAGRQETDLSSQLASGIYIYRIEIIGKGNIPRYRDVKKMLLIK